MKVQKKGGEKLPTHHYALFCPIYLMLSQFTFFQLKSNNLLSICYVSGTALRARKAIKIKDIFPVLKESTDGWNIFLQIAMVLGTLQ